MNGAVRNFFLLAAFASSMAHGLAQWTVLVYIQGDNNLAPFANYNVSDMMTIGSTPDVNIVVQWDKPRGQGTFRYKVEKGGKTLLSQLNQSMSVRPVTSLVESASWIKGKFPAQKYMYVLWNHGNGVLDRSKPSSFSPTSWIQLPGMDMPPEKPRGVLYGDTQGTYVATTELRTAFSSIAGILGQQVDIVGFDACLMAMIEVAAEIKDYAGFMVASQETEAGIGWPYSKFLSALVSRPSMSAADLSKVIVDAYARYYSDPRTGDDSFTLSSFDLSKTASVAAAITEVASRIAAVAKVDSSAMFSLARTARLGATEFYISSYIDLYSFYQGLAVAVDARLGRLERRPRPAKPGSKKAVLQAALSDLRQSLGVAMSGLLASVVESKAGSAVESASGLSIYYPTSGSVNRTYKSVDFIKETPAWLTYLQFTGLR